MRGFSSKAGGSGAHSGVREVPPVPPYGKPAAKKRRMPCLQDGSTAPGTQRHGPAVASCFRIPHAAEPAAAWIILVLRHQRVA